MLYAVPMVIFLIGSAYLWPAQSMEQLMLFRAIQGVGAGGFLPLAFM